MMNEVEVVGRQVANPFGSREVATVSVGGLISVEQQKAVAEVQARMIIARANPRDVIRATDRILQDCTRPTLAQSGLYQYARGGTDISGPSIKLIEAIASRWGNIASGIKEISRHDGFSECVAYAWDLETGYYDERQFQVRHWRDTNKGGYKLSDERDIYELIANMGQRRKRAVLQTVIPGDVIEAAVEQCEETLRASADTSPEALKKIVEAFGAYGVTQDAIEKRMQRRLEAIRPAQVVQLRRIYNSLKDGVSEPADWFGMDPITEAQVSEWRDTKDGKITKPQFDDVGLDRAKLIAQGNAICHDTDLLKLFWNDHLSREQRVFLGAGKGQDRGPVMGAWSKGQKWVDEVPSPPTGAEQPADDGGSGEPASPPVDSFGLPVDADEAFCNSMLKYVRECTTQEAVNNVKLTWSPGALHYDHMERLPEGMWKNLHEQIRQHELSLRSAK